MTRSSESISRIQYTLIKRSRRKKNLTRVSIEVRNIIIESADSYNSTLYQLRPRGTEPETQLPHKLEPRSPGMYDIPRPGNNTPTPLGARGLLHWPKSSTLGGLRRFIGCVEAVVRLHRYRNTIAVRQSCLSKCTTLAKGYTVSRFPLGSKSIEYRALLPRRDPPP